MNKEESQTDTHLMKDYSENCWKDNGKKGEVLKKRIYITVWRNK